jgi:NADPH:quinone reductase-like Zn-dependent oxidoreductase
MEGITSMIQEHQGPTGSPDRMSAIRLHRPSDPNALAYEQLQVPRPGQGEVLVRVHAAAITRDELDWPADRLPATPSYEFSGIVTEVGPGGGDVTAGQEVFALSGFDRDSTRSWPKPRRPAPRSSSPPPPWSGGGYGGSFADLDGYIWSIGYSAQGKDQPYAE